MVYILPCDATMLITLRLGWVTLLSASLLALTACAGADTSGTGGACGSACPPGAGAGGDATNPSGTTSTGAGGAGGGSGEGGETPSAGPPCRANRFVTTSADGSGDGSDTSPWTLAQAMLSAVAGDCVQVGAGVYTGAATGSRLTPAFSPASSGTKPTEVVFLGQPPLRVDLLRSIDGVDSETLFARAVRTTLDDLSVRFISLDDLIANKSAAGRPQDLVDVEFLTRVREALGSG